jgi:dimethylargininase
MPLVALTREISPAIDRCELTHLARAPIDVDAARAQHVEYERALAELGCRVERLPAGEDQPDSVFVEDTAVVLDEVAVVARPGAPSRRAEPAAVADALRSYRPLVAIEAPGTLDGGDVLRLGRTLFVGVGARTNDAGLSRLARLLAPFGYAVEGVAVERCLHLKSAATLVADDLLLVNPEWVAAGAFGGARTLAVDVAEPFAANALLLEGVVIFPAEYERTGRRLEDAGVRVRPVPAGELAKAEGGVTCCSLIVEA